MRPSRRIPRALISLAVVSAIWLPTVHLFFAPDVAQFASPAGLPPRADQMLRAQAKLWTDPASKTEQLRRMRIPNAQRDFIGRTFLVLSLAETGLREPDSKELVLQVMDAIIKETLEIENDRGFSHFLESRAQQGPFALGPARSLLVDGQIALMLGARRMLEDRYDYRKLLTDRVAVIAERMGKGPVLSAESYPNECGTFCNTMALAAIRIADHLDGTDHSALMRRWVETARQKLIDPRTGLLVSRYMWDGQRLQGPEGASLWFSVYCLRLVDEEFAADQYRRARQELSRKFLGFGYARACPPSWADSPPSDTGPVIPILDAGVESSGFALTAAHSFGDTDYLSSLLTSLEFAGLPMRTGGELRYCATGQAGNAVIFYSTVAGPFWDRAKRKAGP